MLSGNGALFSCRDYGFCSMGGNKSERERESDRERAPVGNIRSVKLVNSAIVSNFTLGVV